MALVYQIPRNSLWLLLIAQILAVLPHFAHLPIWLVAAWLLASVWRLQVYRGVWNFPSAKVKFLLVILCFVGLTIGYGKLYGLEPMVGVLVSAFILKLLEMYQRRDALVVIYLGFFVIASQFLFFNTLDFTLYGLMCFMVMIAALMGVNQSQGFLYPVSTLKRAGLIVLQSLPIMAVLFFVVPKVGTLWALPSLKNAASTGVSDSMSPGDFTSLTQSRETAFRVSFDGQIPSAEHLYWRGLVFSYFDGRTWTQSQITEKGYHGAIMWQGGPMHRWARNSIKRLGDEVSYQITMEPSQQIWMYSLAVPSFQDDIHTSKIGFTRDFRLISNQPISQRRLYRVKSHLDYQLEADYLAPGIRAQALQLPNDGNVESRQMASTWRAEAGSDQAYIDRVLAHFNQSFIYTLQPPALGTNSVDEFLWGTQKGFCEHYSSSFVFMMRAAGIPARVVVGYQGGEVNTLENYLMVRQMDAHAWAEVWLRGQGWVRVDPTAAVAPERIENGLDESLSVQDTGLIGSPLSLDYYRGIAWINHLRLRWDAVNYSWQLWVLTFDRKEQLELLHRLLGGVSPMRIAIALLGVGGTCLGLISLWLWLKRRPKPLDPATRQYVRFSRKLEKHGLAREPGEPPQHYAKRVIRERPELEAMVSRITWLYERIHYAEDAHLLKDLRLAVSQFKVARVSA